MPQVGNKKFPYTPSGIKQAANARRQKIAGAMDKVYRPDRDGPKRVAQTLPTPRPGGPSVRPIKRDPQFGRPAGPVGRPAQRPGKPGRRPMRGALAPRPWRPKPPNRRYL